MSDIADKFSDVVRKWRAVDSQRMIFGVDMPQTQRAIDELSQSLQKVLAAFPVFSLAQKDQGIEIVIKNDGTGGDASSLSNIPANLPSLPKTFNELMVNSVTLSAGITETELKEFFKGLSIQKEEIEKQGGLKEFLRRQGVTHIKVNQMKFQLLKDEEQIIISKEGAGKILKDGTVTERQKVADNMPKPHDSVWKDYLDGKLNAEDFKNQHEGFINTLLEKPKQLEKILKRMIAKQKEAEKFLAHLERKLFEIGFPAEAVETLRKKLLAPKKVLVPEDELARLRKIEKEFQKSADKRMDGALETINVIKKKLTDEKARSEAILHQMSQGGMILDRKGKILSINAAAQNVLGAFQKDVRGKSINEVITKRHLLTMVSDWQGETDTHTPKEVKVQASDEETLSIIRESAVVIADENGRSIGVISALHNDTQQEELKRRKNDILDVLGHDLRAPLGAIKQNFEVLNLNIECDSQQRKFLDNCKRNIARMGSLIEKILDMRQLETGKIMLKYDTIEINKLLEEAVASLSAWAENKKIRLEVNAEELPRIDGDPERLYQVITNLVSNALKFTPEGGSIVITGNLIQREGIQHVGISVKDSGMGINTEDLERIFDKYEQVTRNAPAGVSGLGLGLSVCKTIIELHGGSIWADSELNSGSTFTFQLPVARVAET